MRKNYLGISEKILRKYKGFVPSSVLLPLPAVAVTAAAAESDGRKEEGTDPRKIFRKC